MKKNKLLKNAFLLMLGGFITKILGFMIKILYTRYLKEEGVALLSLIAPTYALLLTLSSFQIPIIVTKLTAEKKYSRKKTFINSLYITFILDIILIVSMSLFSSYFSKVFLHNENYSKLINILCITLPFVSVTSLIKAYFFGKENVIPVMLSNISEEVLKLFLIVLVLKKVIYKGILFGTIIYLLINLLCEVISFIILYIFLPKRINISKLDFKFDLKLSSSIISQATPLLSSRLIGSISYFLEPIIITNLLLYKNYNLNYISLNYGYYNGYTLQLLMLPSFFLISLSNVIIAPLSSYKIKKDIKSIKRLISKILVSVFFLGLLLAFMLNTFGKQILILLFNSSNGYAYLKMLLPFFTLFYLENPLITILQAFDKQKKILKISIINFIFRYTSLTVFVLLGFGFKSVIFSEITSIFTVVVLCLYYLNKSYSDFS